MIPIPVIYYHSVAPRVNTSWAFRHITLHLDRFRDQLKLLERMGYAFVGLEDIYRHRTGEQKLHHRSVCLTFDDGHLDYWQYVFPLQKKMGFKSVIFVNPEFTDPEDGVRPNLDDHWAGKIAFEEIGAHDGHLSWDEMARMEKSGLVDIQSHTMTHTKYVVSGRLMGFHHPGSHNIFPLWNHKPEIKPHYKTMPDFERVLPHGYPLFEQEGAMVARKVTINPDLVDEILAAVKQVDFSDSGNYPDARRLMEDIHRRYHNAGTVVTGRESEEEYEQRLEWELRESKTIIENRLNKRVDFCCWPMGYTSARAHEKALDIGYLATTTGKMDGVPGVGEDPTRINRMGLGQAGNGDNPRLTALKNRYQVNSFQKRFPWYGIKYMYYLLKHRRRP